MDGLTAHPRLVMLSDDLTGALDAGIKLAKNGVKVFVTVGSINWRELPADCCAVVVDVQTRHLPPQKAYEAVLRLVGEAVERGVPHLYKKTDSGLRGNIGAELAALSDGLGGVSVAFLPAFPEMNRVTVGGVHYCDGLPVSETVFGRDPFEPVTESEVVRLIARQTAHPCRTVAFGELPCDLPGEIQVFDAGDDRQMKRIGEALCAQGRLQALAGCAGFAKQLPGLLRLPREPVRSAVCRGSLLAVSASLNQVTLDQIACAEEEGWPSIVLGVREKLSGDDETQLPLIRKTKTLLDEKGYALMIGARDRSQMVEFVPGEGGGPLRERIAANVAKLALRSAEASQCATLVVFGGDLLLSVIEQGRIQSILPVAEIASGVVLSKAQTGWGEINLVSKSGGFGSRRVLLEIADYFESND